MTTRDKISQAYLLLSGDATKMIVKKATTRIDTPPKEKHLLTLSQHCLNPRADLSHVFDCLSIRERKPDWRIASKALITMHHLLKTGNQRLWNTVASRPTIFDLCGYVDNSSLIAITMSTYVMNYAHYLAIKCETFRSVGKDIMKKECLSSSFHVTQTQEIFIELGFLDRLFKSIELFKIDFSIRFPILLRIQILLVQELLLVYMAQNKRLIFLLGFLMDLEAGDAAKMFDFYKEAIRTNETLQNLINIATSLRINGFEGIKFASPSQELVSGIEEAVRDVIRLRGSRQLQNKWNIDIDTTRVTKDTTLTASNFKLPSAISTDQPHDIHSFETNFPPTSSNSFDLFQNFPSGVPVTPHSPMAFTSNENRQNSQPLILFPDSNDSNNQFGQTQRSVTVGQQSFPRILPSPNPKPQIPKNKTVDELLMENIDFAYTSPSVPFIWNSQNTSSVENTKPYYNIETSTKSTNPFL